MLSSKKHLCQFNSVVLVEKLKVISSSSFFFLIYEILYQIDLQSGSRDSIKMFQVYGVGDDNVFTADDESKSLEIILF